MYSQKTYFDVPKALEPGAKKRWYQQWWGILILIFLGIFLAILTAVIFYFVKMTTLLQSGELAPDQLFATNSVASPTRNLPTLATTDDPSYGPKDAKVVVVEFADFACPACQQVQPVVRQVIKDYGNKILFVFRDFPLINDHPQALLAAMAGECAHEQGKFWEMDEKMFGNPDQLAEADLKTYATQIGLNQTQFDECLTSGKYTQEIEEDLQAGYQAGVEGTPTFFINGVKTAGAIPFNMFERLITTELNR
ncbi:MAG: thioredoxin domain-containing protein [Patescibacteria group bacterium]|jgi:protein-disulfide isomerase